MIETINLSPEVEVARLSLHEQLLTDLALHCVIADGECYR